MAEPLQARLMGQGLRLLNRLAGASILDNARTRHGLARALFGASRAGFAAAGVANRPFKAIQRLGKAARPTVRGAGDLFDLTPDPDQQMLVEAVQRFAAEELRPNSPHAESVQGLSKQLRSTANDLGLCALAVPEALGGVAADTATSTQVLIAEALAHGDMGQAVALMSTPAVATALVRYGNAEQQASYLPALVAEQPPHAAIAIHEDQTLFDLRHQQASASRSGDGFRLNADKALVINPGEAELFLVSARLDDRPAMFIVESGVDGLSWEPQPAMGLRAASFGRLRLNQVQLPSTVLLAESALPLDDLIARSRLAWCALAAGTAQAVLEYVIPYCNEREAFGEPISHRQAVAFMISDIAIELEGLRLATRRAAARADQGLPFAHEAQLAHQLCQQHARMIGAHGVQLLGGHGFVKEHPVERWYRDLLAVSALSHGLLV